MVLWHYGTPKMTQHKQLSQVLLMLKNVSQISIDSIARDTAVTQLGRLFKTMVNSQISPKFKEGKNPGT